MAKENQFITAVGTALYPSLRTPETFEGNEIGYTVKVIFSQEETNKMEKHLLNLLEEAKSLPEMEGKKWGNAPTIGMGETQDGEVFFKFKKKSSYVSKKSGQLITTTVPIFDAMGKPLPANIDIGNGSQVKVAYTVYPFNKSRQIQGLSLRLEAVQVIKLVERGAGNQDAGSFGFGSVEGGYVAPTPDEFPPADEGADF